MTLEDVLPSGLVQEAEEDYVVGRQKRKIETCQSYPDEWYPVAKAEQGMNKDVYELPSEGLVLKLHDFPNLGRSKKSAETALENRRKIEDIIDNLEDPEKPYISVPALETTLKAEVGSRTKYGYIVERSPGESSTVFSERHGQDLENVFYDRAREVAGELNSVIEDGDIVTGRSNEFWNDTEDRPRGMLFDLEEYRIDIVDWGELPIQESYD